MGELFATREQRHVLDKATARPCTASARQDRDIMHEHTICAVWQSREKRVETRHIADLPGVAYPVPNDDLTATENQAPFAKQRELVDEGRTPSGSMV